MSGKLVPTTTSALIALLFGQAGKVSPSYLRRQFEIGRDPVELLEQGDEAVLVGRDVTDELDAAAGRVRKWATAGISVLTPFDQNYPAQLRTVFDYPVVIFVRGHVIDDVRSVAIVGSRQVSQAGIRFADELAGRISDSGITVVSGLARGVDGTAHAAALRRGARTVSVLGNGLNYVYPREHSEMQAAIARTGLVISQYLPEERPTRQSFPARNITMSAYSTVTAIVEAEEKSGTRIQADAAVKHGRPLILTEQVAASTSWGRRYADGNFDATVVATAEEAAEAAEKILVRVRNAAAALLPV